MKKILFILFVFLSAYSYGQIAISQDMIYNGTIEANDTIFVDEEMKFNNITGSGSFLIMNSGDSIVELSNGNAYIDSSKWELTGANIANKNSGHVSIAGTMKVFNDGEVKIVTDAASDSITVGGMYDINTTPVGNVGSGEDDLMTFTIPAGALGDNGDMIRAEGFGTFAANSQSKTIKLYFGTTQVGTVVGTTTFNAIDWRYTMTAVRTGASTGIVATTIFVDSMAITEYTAVADTFAGTYVVKATGTASSDNDIQQLFQNVEYFVKPD